MDENKDIHEENLDTNSQNTENTEQENQENVSQQPTAEELLAEEKDRYIRLYAEFENYKKKEL